MAESDPLLQVFNLFAAPLAGAVQSFDQFRNGVEQFQRGVENFNRTMENLNETAERINGLLSEVEEPLRAAVPRVTRTVRAADEMMKVVSGPAMAVAPGLQALAETLNNPAMKQIPNQLAQMNEVLAEVTARLAPLGLFAESAGGLFGGLRLPGFGGAPKPGPTPATDATSEADGGDRSEVESADDETGADGLDEQTASKTTIAETTTAKRTTAKRTTAKKSAAKKTTGKKSAAKKSAAKKSATPRKIAVTKHTTTGESTSKKS